MLKIKEVALRSFIPVLASCRKDVVSGPLKRQSIVVLVVIAVLRGIRTVMRSNQLCHHWQSLSYNDVHHR